MNRPIGDSARTQIKSDSIVQRARDIAFSQLDDELLAIDAQAEFCYSLNEPAGRVWELIAKPRSVGSICAQLCREYKVDEPTCLTEVSAVLQALLSAGLVQTANATSC
jgi:hypothetical protein